MKYGIIAGVILVAVVSVLWLAGRRAKGQIPEDPGMERSYTQITEEEARIMMAKDDGHILVDVRSQEEYESGHIPGAVCIPNESITDTPPAELPRRDQIILVYCRSGRRSKEAAQKLFDMGYTRVYEFGGILDWKGAVVTETVAAPAPVLVIDTGHRKFYAVLEENSSAQALIEKLSPEAISLSLHDYGGFEKVGPLPWKLPQNDESITARPGDVILYQGDQLTIYYGENAWNLTRLARIGGADKDELLAALGEADVTVTLYLEWSE